MNLCSVRLRSFRNHRDSRLDFGAGLNVLVGDNGQGKTNILEAISYLSLTKSFYAASDETVLQLGTDRFEVEGVIRTAAGNDHVVRCIYTLHEHEKIFTINAAMPERLRSVIGRFPIVVLSPEHSAITSGAPAERRKFLDLTLSQVSRGYFDDLMEYRRILKQRNRILSDARAQSVHQRDLLDPWDVSLVKYGSSVIQRRCVFLNEINRYVQDAYASLVDRSEEPSLEYICSVDGVGGSLHADEIEELMKQSMERVRYEEFRRGMSLIGPHRDDVQFLLSGRAVRAYASQGQHKTLLVGLKLAEFSYLRERKLEAPMFLLDDLFSELDAGRIQRILALISGLGQTILTTTNEAVFHGAVAWNALNRRLYVENGTCRPG
jgi:DNA replication and repair protein RecF